MQQPAEMATAEVEVLGSLVHVDRPFLVEDPAADLPFALAQSPQGRIDLDRQGLRQGWRWPTGGTVS